ncbi:hypothetical protein VTP01DRAFT_3112 [Rhizomucor pusillus]|uniref:uncharacterized protein n=1 Tax=Rhizomucor pusillus TaxID=4840 RepID=UPI003744780D
MNVARQILSELPSKPSIFSTKGKNLYELLSVLPGNGVGTRVASSKILNTPALKDSFYEITKVRFKPGNNLKHGKAWGVHVRNGRTLYDGKPVEIRGGLKYNWKQLSS